MPGSPSLVGRAPGILSNHKARSRKGSRVQISLPAPNLSFESLFQKHFNQNMTFPLQMANDVIYADWMYKGFSLGEMGKHKEAIECFDKAIEIDEKRTHAWLSKGIVLRTLEKHEDAILCLDKAIERCDDDEDGKGDKVKVEALISKAASLGEMHGIQFKPIPATIYPQKKYTAQFHSQGTQNMKKEYLRWLGVTQAQLDILCAVIECCDKAIEIDEKKLNAWSNKGLTLVLLRNHEEAIECFDNALKIDDRDKMSWWFKGYSLGQLLRIEEAKICQSIAEQLDE